MKLSVVLALAYFFSAHRTVWQMMPALVFAAACLLLLMMQRDLGTALIYYLTTLVLFYVACGNVPLTVVGLGGGVGAAVLTTGGTISISDSTMTNLACEGEIVDAAGNAVSVVGTYGAVYVQGDSEYTVTVGNYAETCDLTGAGEITGWDASVMPM